MKFKIEVDLSEFVTELEEWSEVALSEELTNNLKYHIVKSASAEIQQKSGAHIGRLITETVEAQMQEFIDKTINSFSLNTVVQQKRDIRRLPSGRSEFMENITLQDLIEANVANRLQSIDLQRGVDAYINRSVDNSVSQIRQQYDLFFATQFLRKVGEQGMLKEGVLESLIPRKDED